MARKASKISDPGRRHVADRLHSASLRLLRLLRLQDKASGIGPARLSTLSVLVFGGPCTLKQLAVYEQVRPPTMSRIVAGLVRGGLVSREVDRVDRRKSILTATAKGLRVMQAGRRRRVAYLTDLLGSLPLEEIQHLDRAAELMFTLLQPRAKNR